MSNRYTALYFDGQRAGGETVRIRIEADQLFIEREDGTELGHWPLSAIEQHPAGARGGLRLSAPGIGDERLIVTDESAIAALRAEAPQLFRARGGALRLAKQTIVLAAVTTAVVGGLYLGVPRAAEAIVPFIPPETEKKVGAQIYRSTGDMWGFCTAEEDQPGLAVVHGLAKRLLASQDVTSQPTVDVANVDMINAFALPGGHVVLTRGLIEKAESPDEVAGVLAHELGHVVERHAMIGMVQDFGLNLLLTLVLGGGSHSGEWIVNSGATLASLSYSRRLETRADERGIDMLEASGISPIGFARFFERLDPLKGDPNADEKGSGDKGTGDKGESAAVSSVAAIWSTHPPSPIRAERARHTRLTDAAPSLTDADWALVRQICASQFTDGSEPSEAADTGDGPAPTEAPAERAPPGPGGPTTTDGRPNPTPAP